MTDKELLQQALEALETVFMPHHPAVIALRERLARQEPTCEYCGGDRFVESARQEQEPQHTKKYVTQEPVAHLWQHSETGRTRVVMPDQIITADATWHVVGPLYLAPPARQWQGLSEEEIALLEWAVSTLSDFSASDRSRPAWQFVYIPKLADLRNVVEQHRAKLKEKNT